ncbi:MAG: hypothetical protein WCI73_16190, partial [Phycisphaerae bacterium]
MATVFSDSAAPATAPSATTVPGSAGPTTTRPRAGKPITIDAVVVPADQPFQFFFPPPTSAPSSQPAATTMVVRADYLTLDYASIVRLDHAVDLSPQQLAQIQELFTSYLRSWRSLNQAYRDQSNKLYTNIGKLPPAKVQEIKQEQNRLARKHQEVLLDLDAQT